MKWKVWYGLFYASCVVVASYIVPIWSLLISLGLTYRQFRFLVLEAVALLVSYLITSRFDPAIFTYVMRAFTFINLFLSLSEFLDRVSLLGLLGEKGVPFVVTLSYIPLFYELASDVFFYRRARKLRFNVEELSRPIVVEMVKIAEDLNRAYEIKLYGKFSRRVEFKPSRWDFLPITAGVVSICLSLLIPIFPVK
ncbi:hypothetical protein L3N51_01661 [Metallosphaera sp. J1]|uniref:hypothetical protein n=1 Tax=Metallosphaera javensis (ex Hofmann et al. 2022) TaxID=99938 RepID=UPI001EDFF51F|nr:hypothetical protein [Metallosphaera javensis (ex Hofmann et al. 2022)]MCG3109370.1 hypothetical protein [Metallosphaera javensis (ex Hofmann et al. 2022)]